MRIWIGIAAFAVVVAAGGTARADDKKVTDTRFVDHAYTGGQNEVILGRLALNRSSNEDVAKFATRMIEDHTKANNELTLIVSDLRIAVPDKPLPDQEKLLGRLHGNDLKNFDREYMDSMVKDHEEDLKLFEAAAKDLKNGASKTLQPKRCRLSRSI